ncbi:similar to Saccharomyces cerevisiae YER089C PTC2 Type 2C protein phosphatase (PP2C) [Maudiozyma saulgeensis]|uniref:protein-serine/threonine phosphatase n=1 Tax=Maudiozyma saulgeensis TaxID=1789683 RepID=A0A1X7R4L4_9SACH|nr:similar to Saccharomyces cerevisiae YER089C PTC2 Type 2C protein phosphatase (PP2C) [Kazachstania saulgeensis]
MGQILSNPVIDKERSEGSDEFTAFGLCAMQGWRMSMEDTHLTEPDVLDSKQDKLALYAIFDGHGGSGVSTRCTTKMTPLIRHLLHHSFAEYINVDGKTIDYRKLLIKTFLEIDEDISKNQELVREQSGSTATVVLISKKLNRIICANAGDSRTVLSADGVAKALSFDHKPNLTNEISRIVAAGGYVEMGRVNGNLALSRAVGDFTYKGDTSLPPQEQIVTVLPDVIQHTLNYQSDEFLILACDGIWDCLSSQDCVNLIHFGINKGNMSLTDISARIIDVCCAPTIEGTGIGCDNMSITIVALLKDGESIDQWFQRIRMKNIPDTISFEQRRRMIYAQYLPKDRNQLFAITTPTTDFQETRELTHNINPSFQTVTDSTQPFNSTMKSELEVENDNDFGNKEIPIPKPQRGSLDLFEIEKIIESGIKEKEQPENSRENTSNEKNKNNNEKHSIFNRGTLGNMLTSFTTAAIGEPAPFLSEEEEESEKETQQSKK